MSTPLSIEIYNRKKLPLGCLTCFFSIGLFFFCFTFPFLTSIPLRKGDTNEAQAPEEGLAWGREPESKKKNGGERGRQGVRKKGKSQKQERKKAQKERNFILGLKFKWCFSHLIKNVFILSNGAHC